MHEVSGLLLLEEVLHWTPLSEARPTTDRVRFLPSVLFWIRLYKAIGVCVKK